ncbi:tumor necrosis factor ligand superfamily member 18 isoform X2 [Xyrauchen texanus]|uniref:tumor necrosis factor ligand superfamily member 18 isoform X2 n=1 Tax=Xyrauchen texanus TaxID=154827 RepID=UPI0022420011|nr:tumor necrosis factor ligand superfamily member 18 isoform X2 [Xyrauchen texanus]
MMSLSTEYCKEKTEGRDGVALAQQRRLIWGFLVWSTLLTIGVAASITVQIIHGAPAQKTGNISVHQNVTIAKAPPNSLVTFEPNCDDREKVAKLSWETNLPSFIEGKDQLEIKEDGQYFIYLQVTLESGEPQQKYTVTVYDSNVVILKGHINELTLSTGLIGKGTSLNKGSTLSVHCTPKAKIQNSATETYLGVIKL